MGISAELSPKGYERSVVYRVTALMAAGALTLSIAACNGGEDNEQSSPAPPSETTAESGATTNNCTVPTPELVEQKAAEDGFYLIFNSLGANACSIQTYPGVSDSEADKTKVGEYFAGEVKPVSCRATGREVSSVPPEESRKSTEWLLFTQGIHTPEFATAVYADVYKVEDGEATIVEPQEVKACEGPKG